MSAIVAAPPGKYRQSLLQIAACYPRQSEMATSPMWLTELFAQQAAPLSQLFPGDSAHGFALLVGPQGIKVANGGWQHIPLLFVGCGALTLPQRAIDSLGVDPSLKLQIRQ